MLLIDFLQIFGFDGIAMSYIKKRVNSCYSDHEEILHGVPLVWMFHSKCMKHKIIKINESPLKLLHDVSQLHSFEDMLARLLEAFTKIFFKELM